MDKSIEINKTTANLKGLYKALAKIINKPIYCFQNDGGGFYLEVLNPYSNVIHDSGNIFIDDDKESFFISFGMSNLKVDIDFAHIEDAYDKVNTFVSSLINKSILSFQAIGEFGTCSGYFKSNGNGLKEYVEKTFGKSQAIYSYIWGEKDSKKVN